MSIEAMKQALEALEHMCNHTRAKVGYKAKIVGGAMDSLHQAIAEAEQEQGKPIAEVTSETGAEITMSWWHEPALPIGTKLYTTPQQCKPLTDEQIEQLWESTASYYYHCDFARAIEAAHGIKGEA